MTDETKIKSGQIGDGEIKTANIADGAVSGDKIPDGGIPAAKLSANALSAYYGVRQTVRSKNMVLPASNALGLSLRVTNVDANNPLIVSAANGNGLDSDRVGIDTTGTLEWTDLTPNRAAGSPNYLYVDIDTDGVMTTGSTVTAPVYSPTEASGTNRFNTVDMIMYVSNAAAYRVFIGEAATDGSTVLTTVEYAHNGIYVKDWSSVASPTLPLTETITHNIGIEPSDIQVLLYCKATDQGWLADEMITRPLSVSIAAGDHVPLMYVPNKKTAYLKTLGWAVVNKTTGVCAGVSDTTKWKYMVICKRGW